MAESQNVTLPNGTVINNIPVGTSKQEIQDKAIAAGLATINDFAPQQGQDLPWYEDVGNFFKENMEIPVGIGGSIAGAVAGAPFGPVGAIGGAIIGGAVGSGGGSLLSDQLTGEELDGAKAVEEALISMGFDVATLGLGKYVKAGWIAGKQALGYTPKEMAEQIAKEIGDGTLTAGTKESLAKSQQILQEGGGSLTPFQTGEATSFDIIKQRLAETGLLSSKVMEDNASKVNQTVNDQLQSIMGNAEVYGSSDLGELMYDVVSSGKRALSESYGKGLDEVQGLLDNQLVNVAPLKNSLSSFVAAGDRGAFNTLDESTVGYVNKLLTQLENTDKLPANALIDLEKKITQQISQFGDINSGVYNGVAERELAQLSSALRGSVSKIIGGVNADAASKYAGIKKAYSEGVQTILPEINASFVKRAAKDNYTSLGKMLTHANNTDQISNFFKSIDKAYAVAAKEGAKDLPFKSAKEAKESVRASFMQNLLPNLKGPDFDIEKYAKLAQKLSSPSEAKRMSLLLGDKYKPFMQLLNVMEEASKKPTSDVATLLLRAKEYGAIGAFGGGLALQSPALALTSAAILFTPVVFAKMATKPKVVNRMIMLSKRSNSSRESLEKSASLILNDLVDASTEEEQAEIRNYLRELSNPQ